jgi:tetratricopeptide (TPR) repeat protein
MGDAAWLSDRRDLAKRRWERSVALAPRRSWKSYEKLASVSEGEAGQSYWARLKSAFFSGPASSERDGAIGAYACFLAREGRENEALAILGRSSTASPDRALPGKLAVLGLAIRSASMPEGRIVSQYEALAAQRPLDPEVMGAALRTLSQRGMYGEVAVLRDGAERRGLGLEYGWYYEAEILAARGELSKAIGVIKTAGGQGAEGLFALGSLYSALGDNKASADAYSKAAIVATGKERCAAYKALGSSFLSSGDREGAARAYREALAAWPDDAEAAMLARQSERKGQGN